MPENTKYEIGKVGLRAGFSRAEMFFGSKFFRKYFMSINKKI